MRYLSVFLLIMATTFFPASGMASKSDVPSTIENFVSQIYPKGSSYHWIINNATGESSNDEMIIDLQTTLRGQSDEPEEESRFLLLIIKGTLFAAQKIPLDAKVDCTPDEEV
jgi:hypothetical protein